VILWRLSPARHAKEALSGEGAALRGGRWNSRGMKAVYASLDPATTVLEALTTFDPALVPAGGYRLLKLVVPEGAEIIEPALGELPRGWADWERPDAARAYGDAFLKSGRGLVLIVPCAALPQAKNALISLAHPRAREIAVAESFPFEFDPRWPLKRG
jgi:RES domain-containing protein